MYSGKKVKMYLRFMLCAAMALVTSGANAATLYEQIYDSSSINGPLADSANPLIFDDFNVGPVTLRDIVWWGVDGVSVDNTFTVKIYDSNNDLPGSELHSFDNLQLSPSDGGRFKMYQYMLPNPVNLNGKYFLSIQNLAFDGWSWLYGQNGDNKNVVLDPPNFLVEAGDLAFRLEGDRQTVPEPTSLMLVLLGFASAAAVRNRSKFSPIV